MNIFEFAVIYVPDEDSADKPSIVVQPTTVWHEEPGVSDVIDKFMYSGRGVYK